MLCTALDILDELAIWKRHSAKRRRAYVGRGHADGRSAGVIHRADEERRLLGDLVRVSLRPPPGFALRVIASPPSPHQRYRYFALLCVALRSFCVFRSG